MGMQASSLRFPLGNAGSHLHSRACGWSHLPGSQGPEPGDLQGYRQQDEAQDFMPECAQQSLEGQLPHGNPASRPPKDSLVRMMRSPEPAEDQKPDNSMQCSV